MWSYGHPGSAGAANGYLTTPDDAHRLANGQTVVADIRNCRILFLAGRPAHPVTILGRSTDCSHGPPHTFASPQR